MAPGGEPLRHIRLHGQNEHHRERRAADGEKERGKAPGAHEGYNEKAHEENERRAEIAYERQRATHTAEKAINRIRLRRPNRRSSVAAPA